MVITTTLTVAYKLYKCYQAGETICNCLTNRDQSKNGVKNGLAIMDGKKNANDLLNMADSKGYSLLDLF